MRIRKRQPEVRENPRSALPPLEGSVPFTDTEQLLGSNSCTCCSRERHLKFWEEENEEPSVRLPAATPLADDDEITEAEADEQKLSAPLRLDPLNPLKRNGSNENNRTTADENPRAYSTGKLSGIDGDGNHPSNKPRGSLLYSLYSVFSKPSGNTVLTAREALSKIMEQGLPGLDDETGLPSVQVAKAMRSNPYFVHLDGGKFFLCTGPCMEDKGEPALMDGSIDFDNLSDPVNSSSRFKIAFLNGFSNVEGQKDEKLIVGKVVVRRNKRVRSKTTSTADDLESGTSHGLKRRGSKTLKSSSQKTVPHAGTDNTTTGARESICKRYDGRGWKCNEKALEGYSMCRHHHELIVNRLARLRNSGKLGAKTSSKRRKIKTPKASTGMVIDGEPTAGFDQDRGQCWKNVKARSLKSINS